MRKCAALLRVDKGDVFFNRDERRVKVVISRDEQRRVLMMAVLWMLIKFCTCMIVLFVTLICYCIFLSKISSKGGPNLAVK